jgi:hypothetical protein
MLNRLPAGWEAWGDAWAPALECWSRFTRMHSPAWCQSLEQAKEKGMPPGIFAMIRLVDHEVVISLPQIERSLVRNYPKEILAHEIGHHVYCPANLADNARLLARVRKGLPGVQPAAPLVSNLYADLLINDRLQRQGLDLASVYRAIRSEGGELWRLYMRTYEVLWSLPRNTLAVGELTEAVDFDAQLAARVVRAYSADWLRGAGRFAALVLPYLAKDGGERELAAWLDMQKSGEGAMPDGLIEHGEGEDDTLHPALDPELSGIEDDGASREARKLPELRERSSDRYRGPLEYAELSKALGSGLSDSEVASKYYRERALPHLVRFPVPILPHGTEPTPEGLGVWDLGSPLARVDWLHSVIRSPLVIPGVTTLTRTHGPSPSRERQRQPVDLYIGIDCSGSMPNPRRQLSYPVLAGAIVGLSALRAGARVQVVLSGEPGRAIATDGFVRSEAEVLALLTSYLGTGYAFGIGRLQQAFGRPRKPPERNVHVFLITDGDIFYMMDNAHEPGMRSTKASDTPRAQRLGWSIARDALVNAGAGGTCVLHMPPGSAPGEVDELTARGWAVHQLSDWPELTRFAREFSRQKFEFARGPRRRRGGEGYGSRT